VADHETRPPELRAIGATIVVVPPRRPWYPPVRYSWPISLSVRCRLWARTVRQTLGNDVPDAIVSGTGHWHLGLAATLAPQVHRPLHVVMHDWWPDFVSDPVPRALAGRVLSRALPKAARVWVASDELAEKAYAHGSAMVEVLRPMPAGWIGPAPNRRNRLQLVAFGSYCADHAPIYAALAARLQALSGSLVVVSPEPAQVQRDLAACSNVTVKPFFRTPEEALAFAVEEADALVVAYPFAESRNPWIHNSFPSKFVEFVHAGLPILLIAPKASSLGNWAVRNRWSLSIDTCEQAAVDAALNQVRTPNTWEICAAEVRSLAVNEFSPDRIHQQLRAGLLSTVPPQP